MCQFPEFDKLKISGIYKNERIRLLGGLAVIDYYDRVS
jgi:hypothetical protein